MTTFGRVICQALLAVAIGLVLMAAHETPVYAASAATAAPCGMVCDEKLGDDLAMTDTIYDTCIHQWFNTYIYCESIRNWDLYLAYGAYALCLATDPPCMNGGDNHLIPPDLDRREKLPVVAAPSPTRHA